MSRTNDCLTQCLAAHLTKAGWSWGCVAAIDSNGRTIWIADAHRDNAKRFVVHADEKLTAAVGRRGRCEQSKLLIRRAVTDGISAVRGVEKRDPCG
jgi:hypothetical protein